MRDVGQSHLHRLTRPECTSGTVGQARDDGVRPLHEAVVMSGLMLHIGSASMVI